jgi:hypothetical protein
MSRVLFIRVSAATYDEKDVPKTWPMLYSAVWPDPELDDTASPAKLARKLIPAPQRGALELVDAFVQFVRFGDIAEVRKKALKPEANKLAELRQSLDDALGNRDVSKAQALCTDIENALDNAENVLRSS